MIHPDTELRFVDDTIGFGVFATRRIPRGTITWVRDPLDLAFAPERFASLDPLYRRDLDKYTFVDARGDHVYCWDIARYVNHSCDAPCLPPGWDVEIAVRDVEVGEELRDDYGTLNLEEPFPCACGAPQCRKVLQPDDPARLSDFWDARLHAAFPDLARVAQPLWSLVAEKESIEGATRDPSRFRSCREQFVRR